MFTHMWMAYKPVIMCQDFYILDNEKTQMVIMPHDHNTEDTVLHITVGME